MTVGLNANNPGDIQASGGNLFQGATGKSLPASNGAKIEVFDNITDGIRALAIDLTNAIGSGYNTVSSLVYHYLGTSSNNAQNPHVQGYLTDVEQQTGLSANSSVSTSNVPSLVSAIINAEGNSSGVSQSALQQGLSAAGYGISSMGSSIGSSTLNIDNVGAAMASALSNPQASASSLLSGISSSASSLGTAAVNTVASPFAGISAFLSAITSTSIITRVVLVLLGVILVTAAIFAFSKPNVNLSDVAKLAPLAA